MHSHSSAPDRFETWYNLAIYFEEIEQFEKAISSYEHVLQLNPEQKEAAERISILK